MERMEKDDILRKAQERKGADELELDVERRGNALSLQIGLVVCAILWIIKATTDQPRFDMMGLYFTMAAVPDLYKGRRLQKKKNFLWGIVWIVLGITCLITYFLKQF